MTELPVKMKGFEFNYKFMIRESCHFPLIIKRSIFYKNINKIISYVKKRCITLNILSVNLSYIFIY
jgi:hypothetical protein